VKRKARGVGRRKRATAKGARGLVSGGVHPALDAINRSFDVDRRLWPEDILGSAVHARMLGKAGILPARTVARILRGLRCGASWAGCGAWRPSSPRGASSRSPATRTSTWPSSAG
jgi:hypothetical protein